MRFFILAILALVAVQVFAATEEEQFQEFMVKFHKTYTPSEYQTRLNIFKANLVRSAELTARDPRARFGVTKFSDLSPEEFEDQYLIKNFTSKASLQNIRKWTAPKTAKTASYPATYDWNDKGVVTPVYNQLQCGSCWAFSTAENIESMWALSGQSLVQLSMQQIVDCDTNDDGCGGGNPPYAYQYVMSAGGLDNYAYYPYVGYQETSCLFNPSEVSATISDWQWITQDDNENNMQSFTFSTGPPSICVDATIWQTYTGGVITSSSGCGTQLDHCVQLTGWTVVDGMSVWNVRNSWGSDWADNGGYIYLQMGADVCGVGQEVTSSII